MLQNLCLIVLALCAAVIAVELGLGLSAMRRVGLQLRLTLRQLNRLLPKCDRLFTEVQHGTAEGRAVIARVRRLVAALDTVVEQARAVATQTRAQWIRVTRPLVSVVEALRGAGNGRRTHRRS